MADVVQEELAKGSVTFRLNAPRASETEAVPSPVLERFRGLSVPTVALAGLLDGINPCAFTAIVFLISMLAYLHKTPREVAVVGIGFTVAVFGTYLLLGLGILRFLEAVKALSVGSGLAAVLTWCVGLLALGLAAWSLAGFVRYRRTGDAKKLTLGLPKSIRTRINRTIRVGLGTRGLLVGSVTVGVLVALLESVCTGQVYLPTIVFVSRAPELRPAAVTYLLLYNVMFIAPLVLILLGAYRGVSSQRLGSFLRRHLGSLKLAMAILFAVLGVMVLATV